MLSRRPPRLAVVAETFGALRERNFRLYWGGQAISLIGTWMQSAAQSWLAWQLTGRASALGYVTAAVTAPVLCLTLLGGAVADRVDQRRLLLGTQALSMLQALALAWLLFSRRITFPLLLVFAAALGTINAFDVPGRQSYVPRLISPARLTQAIALNSSAFNAARMVGPAIAGLLIASLGIGWCFLSNGVSYVAVLIGLWLITARRSGERRSRERAQIGEGLRYVWRDRATLGLVLLVATFSLFGMGYVSLLPIFASKVLHGDAKTYGFLQAASGVGALIGALVLAARAAVLRKGPMVFTAGAAFAVLLAAFALSRWEWLSLLLLGAAGTAMIMQNATVAAAIQETVPNELRGRVMSVYTLMFIGFMPASAILLARATEAVGVRATVAAAGILCLLSNVLVRRAFPEVWRLA